MGEGDTVWDCKTCNAKMLTSQKAAHIAGKTHLNNLKKENKGKKIITVKQQVINSTAKGSAKRREETKKNSSRASGGRSGGRDGSSGREQGGRGDRQGERRRGSGSASGKAEKLEIKLESAERPQTTLAELHSGGPASDHYVYGEFTETEKAQGRKQYFQPPQGPKKSSSAPTLVDTVNLKSLPEFGLLGSTSSNEPVFMNVNDPFALIACGVQGSGKSHTSNVVLENCLIPCDFPGEESYVKLRKPMAGLVLHYDQAETNVCESTGLSSEMGSLKPFLERPLFKPKTYVLCSPTFYTQRKAFYGSGGNYIVKPLLFKWASLTAVQIKKLMRVDETQTQLYMGKMLAQLRDYQRQGGVPNFNDFCRALITDVSDTQSGPLQQRVDMMSQFISEAPCNRYLKDEQCDLGDLLGSGTLVVADLTDPMLAPSEANAIFQVLLEQFRIQPLECGKLLLCDEAHKYFGADKAGGGLAGAITETARLMRHEGIRLVITTQSPLSMPPELLELATMAVLHSFHSKDWYRYLSAKLPLPAEGFQEIGDQGTGEALIFAAKPKLAQSGHDESSDSWMDENRDPRIVKLKIRPRITEDRGASRRNRPENPEDYGSTFGLISESTTPATCSDSDDERTLSVVQIHSGTWSPPPLATASGLNPTAAPFPRKSF